MFNSKNRRLGYLGSIVNAILNVLVMHVKYTFKF